MSPDRRQTIICANARIFLIGPPETKFNEIFNEIFIKMRIFSLKKINFTIQSDKRRPLCLGPNWIKKANFGDLNTRRILDGFPILQRIQEGMENVDIM